MSEKETNSAEPLLVDFPLGLAESRKDSLRYTPSKRKFLELDLPKSESHLKKKVNLSRNSKIVKKKRHKDKLKFSMLDTHILDPTVSKPLMKSVKFLKKRNKYVVNQQNGVLSTSYQPKPLQYTFDLLCSTDSTPLPLDDRQMENDLLTNSFRSMEPIPNDVPKKSFFGDLIVLETPKPLKLAEKDQVSAFEVAEELEKVDNSCLLQKILNPANSGNCSHSRGEETFIIYDGVGNISSPRLESSTYTLLHSNSIAEKAVKLLAEQVTNDPYPKAVREHVKVRVRRRAFSLNDALLSLLFKSEEKSVYNNVEATAEVTTTSPKLTVQDQRKCYYSCKEGSTEVQKEKSDKVENTDMNIQPVEFDNSAVIKEIPVSTSDEAEPTSRSHSVEQVTCSRTEENQPSELTENSNDIISELQLQISSDSDSLHDSLNAEEVSNSPQLSRKLLAKESFVEGDLCHQSAPLVHVADSNDGNSIPADGGLTNSTRYLDAGLDHTPVKVSFLGGDQTEDTPTGGLKISDESNFSDQCLTPFERWVLPSGKKFKRSLSIIRHFDEYSSTQRGRHYQTSVDEIIKLQGNETTPDQGRKRLSMRRSLLLRQVTPPPARRDTFIWSPRLADRGTLYETPRSRKSIYSTPLQKNLALRMSLNVSPGPRKSLRLLNQSCTSPVEYTVRDLILTICKQTEPWSFSQILSKDAYEGGGKIGEGVFGEVFSINRDGHQNVLKIIPIEGQQLVNGEKQKTYQEVLSELVIAKVLDELRCEGEPNSTCGFSELKATSLVRGSYPLQLLQFWEAFDRLKGSDNDNPKLFDNEQLFVVMEQGNGGKDLESYAFSSAKQSLSIFKQVVFSLAVAEISVEFEHRDLHWGNILVTKTSEKNIFYSINGTQHSVPSNGVKSIIIDYTLSRIKYINQFPIYNDIGKDPEMFIATGDYQFDIYRHMKKDVDDDWSRFVPKTNARWLHYLVDKLLTKATYQRKSAKVHKDSYKMLESIGSWIEECGSALSIAMRLAEMKN